MFHLVATQVETLHRELLERKVDLLVVQRFAPLADERLRFEALFDDLQVVMVGTRNPWVRRHGVKLADLVNEPWVLPPPESMLGSIAIEAFRASGLACPHATVFTFPAEARISLLASGRFFTILPASLMRFSPKRPELKVLPIELPLARMPVGTVTVKNRAPGPVAQLFIEHAREVERIASPTVARRSSRQKRPRQLGKKR